MNITERVRDSRAFYAAAGAGDLAVEKLREVPERLTKLQQGNARRDLVNQVSARATEILDDLAERGRRVVGDREESARELENRTRTAGQSRQSTGSARRTTRSTGE